MDRKPKHSPFEPRIKRMPLRNLEVSLPGAPHLSKDSLTSDNSLGLKLPPELLSSIFLAYLPTWPDPFLWITSPLLLCHICHYWREVAFGCRRLWSSLNIELKKPSTQNNLAYFTWWLSRSKDESLSLKLVSAPESDPVVLLFCSQMHRWRELDVGVDSELFLFLYELEASKLEKIVVRDLRSVRWRNSAYMAPIRAHRREILPPVFESLNVREIHWLVTTTIPPKKCFEAWHANNLQCLRFHSYVTADLCLSIMATCSRLEDIEFADYANASKTQYFLRMRAVMPKLHTLVVRSLSSKRADVGQLLDRLTAPSLHSLEIVKPAKHASLKRLLARQRKCSLKHLHLMERKKGDISEADLLSLLSLHDLQTLHSLNLDCIVTDSVFRYLTYSPASRRCSLPCLTEFSVRYGRTTEGVVSDMVSSRWKIFSKQTVPKRLMSMKFCYSLETQKDTNGDFTNILNASTDHEDSSRLRTFAGEGLASSREI